MIQDYERQHDESWVDRWRRLTGRSPKKAIRTTQHLNGSARPTAEKTLRDDAVTMASQKFKKR